MASTSQTNCPMMTSPVAAGPSMYRWAAFTVIEPFGFRICSLKTYRKLSVTSPMWMCPRNRVFWKGIQWHRNLDRTVLPGVGVVVVVVRGEPTVPSAVSRW